MANRSVAIIGEGETEWFYFDALRVARHYTFRVAPDFPQHSDIQHIAYLGRCAGYLIRYIRASQLHLACLLLRQTRQNIILYQICDIAAHINTLFLQLIDNLTFTILYLTF